MTYIIKEIIALILNYQKIYLLVHLSDSNKIEI